MLNGDLSNKISPRILLIFEGAVGICLDKGKHDKLMKQGRWAGAVAQWTWNEPVIRRILWLFHKKDITFELVTFIGEFFAEELEQAAGEDDIPFHRVWWTTPERLGRSIAYMPDLSCVYDPEPTRWLMYGSKGKFLTDVNQIGEGL